MMNRPTPSEQKAMRNLYAVPKGQPTKWVVVHCGKQVYESTSPALCEWYIKHNQLKGAFKKAIYQ